MAFIGSHMADAIGRSSSEIAGFMMKSKSADEDRAFREEQAALNRQSQMDLRREINAGKGSGGSGPPPMTDDQINELASYSRDGEGKAVFKSQDEVAQYRAAKKTGDYSSYQNDTEQRMPGEDGKDVTWSTKTYPSGFEEQKAAKDKALGEIVFEARHGKDSKDVAEGRAINQKTDQVAGIVGGSMNAGSVSLAQAAVKGDGPYKGTNDTVYNQNTGGSTATTVGAARARKDNATANAPPPGDAAASRAALTALSTSVTAQIQELDRNLPLRLKGLHGDQKAAVVAEAKLAREALVKHRNKVDEDLASAAGVSPRASPPPVANTGGTRQKSTDHSSLWK